MREGIACPLRVVPIETANVICILAVYIVLEILLDWIWARTVRLLVHEALWAANVLTWIAPGRSHHPD